MGEYTYKSCPQCSKFAEKVLGPWDEKASYPVFISAVQMNPADNIWQWAAMIRQSVQILYSISVCDVCMQMLIDASVIKAHTVSVYSLF